METREEALEVKKRHSSYLLGLPGVVGVGITKDKSGSYGLLVQVEMDDDDLVKRISERLKGYSVKIERSGRYRKL
jgi:hypothetical protein